MKINKFKMICPKCQKEYINNCLMSFSNNFESEAKNFHDTNVITTHCEICNSKLIHENLINYFDAEGNYSPKTKTMDKVYDLFNLYLDVLNTIDDFFNCISQGEIIISSKINKDKNKICTKLVVIGKYNDNEYELLSTIIDEYSFEIGDRKNKFIENNLVSTLNSIVLNIYNYIFTDDCNKYKDEDKATITYNLINTKYLQ